MSTNKLHVELAAGQSLSIGGAIVTLERKSGQRARLTVLAPPGISIKHPKTHTSAHECAPSNTGEHLPWLTLFTTLRVSAF